MRTINDPLEEEGDTVVEWLSSTDKVLLLRKAKRKTLQQAMKGQTK